MSHILFLRRVEKKPSQQHRARRPSLYACSIYEYEWYGWEKANKTYLLSFCFFFFTVQQIWINAKSSSSSSFTARSCLSPLSDKELANISMLFPAQLRAIKKCFRQESHRILQNQRVAEFKYIGTEVEIVPACLCNVGSQPFRPKLNLASASVLLHKGILLHRHALQHEMLLLKTLYQRLQSLSTNQSMNLPHTGSTAVSSFPH